MEKENKIKNFKYSKVECISFKIIWVILTFYVIIKISNLNHIDSRMYECKHKNNNKREKNSINCKMSALSTAYDVKKPKEVKVENN